MTITAILKRAETGARLSAAEALALAGYDDLGRLMPVGTPVTLVGHGVLLEDHARVAGTINYELACGIETGPSRARRVVLDA